MNPDSVVLSEEDREMMVGVDEYLHGKPSETYSPDILKRFLKVENVGSVQTRTSESRSSEENVGLSSKSSFAT